MDLQKQNIIENNIKQNEVKSIDKKQIVISILQKCYTFTSVELEMGGYLFISLVSIPGRGVPSSNTFLNVEMLGEQKQPDRGPA